MRTYLTFKDIQDRCTQLNDIYEIEEEKFYRIVEKWADREVPTEEKLVASFSELLQVVSDEINHMEKVVEMEPTCRLGCAFCCYFPIIINGMEAKLMKKAMENFPESRREKIEEHIQNYFAQYGEEIEEMTSLNFEEDKDFKLKYRQKNLPCMMLNTETNQCMAYEIRPIPCRTYVNYTDPKVCEDNLMPKEPVSFEFLYSEYMGALNEFLQFLYEEGDTGFIQYPDDMYKEDYLPNWFK
ncbi:YkgJ family cysteine cluster protein [Radiobacillus kanasensis]|uniref:YkgJ family cysteine cluster protein n=1 Tax=Radiobacillus kanasensis TaxID=2844358 RepID=UPI001E5E9D07|nr:YkgJ family cysteine cluster protein [Radiobacillus kanasensis]UFU00637.1 YkgJ family cysteine cluster protein [Radiobacillus kanasensis]